jgi:flavin-dependent dehydrogenase
LSAPPDAQVIVVGVGPAGASTAFFLAQAGIDVLLVDQAVFPRDKPCGDGVASSGLAGLKRMGLSKNRKSVTIKL